ncbi:hypothetical protein A2332_03065 [Candidatus Uhrbacteria bacterium RIFOXYB2_FULL_41_18]|nr:MAG: hypothetical protein A2332_03065 [Candidatus Uhrbacteria bacterium RIFOXYB2_FULL_41_18]
MDPFEDFEKFFQGFSQRTMRSLEGFIPSADIYQTADAVVIEIPLAGVDPDQVEISIQEDILHVKGTMKKKTEVEDRNYVHREIRRGSFQRTIPLPTHVQGEKAHAISEDGLLKISVPKAEQTKEKKIKVKIEQKPKKK